MTLLSTSSFQKHRDRWIIPIVVVRFSVLSFLRNRDLHTAATLAFYGVFALIPLCLAAMFLFSQFFVSSQRVSRAIEHLMLAEGVSGPVNAVSPNPVTNAELTETLGRVLHRPTCLPMPAFAARLAFGEMGQALLLDSARLVPARLQMAGFRFLHRDLEEALRSELAKTRDESPETA